MKRFYIFKDGTQVGSAVEREQALHMIRQYQALETHPFLKAEFSIIAGEEEFIPYPSQRKATQKKQDME